MTDETRYDEPRYLLVKRSLYYRPNSKGYTGIKDEAGRYTLDEVAERFPNMDSPQQDGVGFFLEEEAPDLLEALIEAQYELRDHGHGPDYPAMGRIEDAIARATGEKELGQ